LERHPFLALPLTTAATYALATLSWRLLEKPFLGLKRFFEAKPGSPKSTVNVLVAATLS
jgi:peptidoglycan/LPS O-acetylase OafA/YrhL